MISGSERPAFVTSFTRIMLMYMYALRVRVRGAGTHLELVLASALSKCCIVNVHYSYVRAGS